MLPAEDRQLLRHLPQEDRAALLTSRHSSRRLTSSVPHHSSRSSSYSGSANAVEYRTRTSYKPASAADFRRKEHQDAQQARREQQAAARVQNEKQQAIARLPNLHNAGLNQEMRDAKRQEIEQKALHQDPSYRAHVRKQTAINEAIVTAQAAKRREAESRARTEKPEKKGGGIFGWAKDKVKQVVPDKVENFVVDRAKDVKDAAKRTGRFVKDHASTIGHSALDVGGFIPVVGGAFDLANAGWYAASGDWTNAALSAAAAVPFAGDAAAAGAMAVKYGGKGIKLASKAEKAGTAVRRADVAYKFDTRGIAPNIGNRLTSGQRRKVWRTMADDPHAPLTPSQREEIITKSQSKLRRSVAPTWKNSVTGKTERMELSHEPQPFRDGGHEVTPRWPEDHAAKDPHRHLSRAVSDAYRNRGHDIRREYAKDLMKDYKIDPSKL